MIKYDLTCGRGHTSEAWFRNAGECDRQLQENLVTCPTCGSPDMAKGPMAPAVSRPGQSGRSIDPNDIPALLAAYRHHVEATTEDVGDSFAREARGIEDGTAEDRPIRGRTTREEVRGLIDDGIPFSPIPAAPKAH